MTNYPAGLDVHTRKLTEQAKIFLAEYVTNGGNARNASQVAGYAPSTGARILKSDEAQLHLKHLRKDKAARLGLRQNAVQEKMVKIGFADLEDVADYDGKDLKPKPFEEMNDFGRASVSEIEQVEETRCVGRETIKTKKCRVKQHDKTKVLIGLGKMLSEMKSELAKSDTDSGSLDSEIDATKLSKEERKHLRELLLKATRENDAK